MNCGLGIGPMGGLGAPEDGVGSVESGAVAVDGVQGEAGAFGGEVGVDPADGLFAGEVVSGGGQVDQVDALVLGELVLVGVAVDDGFDLGHRSDDVEEAAVVEQLDPRLVVEAEDGGSVIAGAQEGLEPDALGPAEKAGHHVDDVESIKDNEADGAGGDGENVAAFDRALDGF